MPVNPEGFDDRLDASGKNVGDTIVNLDQSVLKYLVDGTTKVLSSYLLSGEQIVSSP